MRGPLPPPPRELSAEVRALVAAELRELSRLTDREKRGTFRDVLRRRAEEWEAGL